MNIQRLMSTTLLITFALTFAASESGAAITCRKKGDAFFPINEKGVAIGEHGFEDQKECASLVQSSSHSGLVCAWTGSAYGLYNSATGKRYGPADDDIHWSEADQCSHAAKTQSAFSVAVCTWDGTHYIPYSSANNTALSSEDGGWEDFDECVKDHKVASPYAVCGWNEADYLYTTAGTQVPFKFADGDNCQSFLKLYKSLPLFPKMLSALTKKDDLDFTPTPIVSGQPDAKVGFSKWAPCGVPDDMYHMTKNVKGIVVPQCRPDTLYSWGGYDKLEWFKDHMGNGQVWSTPLKLSLFTTESAAATFGYGPIPMRFKIKPNVVFKRVDDDAGTCEKIVSQGKGTKAEFANTVFQRVVVRSGGSLSFVDFIICSPHVIASWSAGTRENYDEIMKDYNWMTTQKYTLWEGYSKQNGVDDFIDNAIDSDQADFSQSTFNIRMNMLKAIAVGGGGIIAAEKGGSTADHFATRWPIYFNPN